MHTVPENILEKLTYGFYIATTRAKSDDLDTRDKDYVASGTVSWVMQSSFEPPMVTVAIQKDSDLNETIGKAYRFAINVLGKDDRDMIDAFAKDSSINGQKINGYSFLNGMKTDSPILQKCLGYVECEVVDIIKTDGDHVLFIGKVVNHELREPEAMPLHEWETSKHYGGIV